MELAEVTIAGDGDIIKLERVMFGEVLLCSGICCFGNSPILDNFDNIRSFLHIIDDHVDVRTKQHGNYYRIVRVIQ